MANVNAILNQRVKKSENSSKMAAMAKQSAAGHLSSFAGVFSVAELSEKEKQHLESILNQYAEDSTQIETDLHQLLSITSEVKAINNQAAILHGERIKKAQQILTKYRDGAFTAWLLATYGNRQTPYNLMQYYEFYESMPKKLKNQIEMMPRQAVYALASRAGSLEKKQEIVENYQGETKEEILTLIRQTFPLEVTDQRRPKIGQTATQTLKHLYKQLRSEKRLHIHDKQKQEILDLLQKIQHVIENI